MDIAVVVPGGITETLQATPLLRTLRAGEPGAHITLLCADSATQVAQGIPAVDTVAGLAALQGRPSLRTLGRLWFELRRRRVDVVLLASESPAVRAAAFLASVPERLGAGGGFSAILLTGRGQAQPEENQAAVWLRLAALAGVRQQLHAPSYDPGQEALREADRIIHGCGLADGRLLVALAPGPGYAEANGDLTAWDGERYAVLANKLSQRHGAGIILLGTAQDRDDIEKTMIDLGTFAVDLSGQLDLHLTAAVLERCDLLVGGDTPLLHLAAAVGTPAVGLFGPTDGRVRGPYGSDHRVIQGLPEQPQHDDGHPRARGLMERIRVEDVLASIEASL